MFKKLITAGAVCCTFAYADFTYQQTSRITGGAMQGMMRVAGAFSKTAREPMVSTHIVKGDRMAMLSGDRIEVIDLNAETMTEIDVKRKTYSVVTFAEIARSIERAAEEMRKKDNQGGEMTFKADVKQTGATKEISGMSTKESIVTITTEFTNTKTGQKGEMKMVMDMWLAPKIAGYDEVRDFYARMARKVIWNPVGGMAGAMMAGQAKGMTELTKEMSKLEGVPVYQVMKFGNMGGLPESGGDANAAQQQPPPQQPQAQQAPPPSAGETAAGAVLGRRLGGLAGGLGGLGRRKKQEEPQQQAPPQPAQQQQPAGPQEGGPQSSLMEMTSELTGFSSAPADASKFDVPAGFKKVESQRYKQK